MGNGKWSGRRMSSHLDQGEGQSKVKTTLGRRLRVSTHRIQKWVWRQLSSSHALLLSMVVSEVQIVSLYYLSKSQHGQPGSNHQRKLEAGNLGNMEPIRYETYIIIVNILYGHIWAGAIFHTFTVNLNTLLLPVLPLPSTEMSHLLRLTVFGYITSDHSCQQLAW